MPGHDFVAPAPGRVLGQAPLQSRRPGGAGLLPPTRRSTRSGTTTRSATTSPGPPSPSCRAGAAGLHRLLPDRPAARRARPPLPALPLGRAARGLHPGHAAVPQPQYRARRAGQDHAGRDAAPLAGRRGGRLDRALEGRGDERAALRAHRRAAPTTPGAMPTSGASRRSTAPASRSSGTPSSRPAPARASRTWSSSPPTFTTPSSSATSRRPSGPSTSSSRVRCPPTTGTPRPLDAGLNPRSLFSLGGIANFGDIDDRRQQPHGAHHGRTGQTRFSHTIGASSPAPRLTSAASRSRGEPGATRREQEDRAQAQRARPPTRPPPRDARAPPPSPAATSATSSRPARPVASASGAPPASGHPERRLGDRRARPSPSRPAWRRDPPALSPVGDRPARAVRRREHLNEPMRARTPNRGSAVRKPSRRMSSSSATTVADPQAPGQTR